MDAVGIDFGTTNSLVATHNGSKVQVLPIDKAPIEFAPYGFDNVMPSVVARDEASRVCFGWEAKKKVDGRFDAVKRMFATQLDYAVTDDGEALAVEEVATMIFAELRRRAVSEGFDARQAVITVPANSKGRARHRTKLCAGMAGLEVLALINEPTAAAMAYAQRHPESRQLLVFDWGGGTLDVTLLHSVDGIFIEQASAGVQRSGGLDFDARLEKLVRNLSPNLANLTGTQKHAFKLDIELAKIRLSDLEVTSILLPDGSELRITRSQFEKEYEGMLDEARDAVELCLRNAQTNAGAIDALVLVGGTCRIPGVRRWVQSLLGLEADPDINPMTAVAEGAAIAASIMTGRLANSDFFVCLEHSLGTFAFNSNMGELEFSPIIRKGTKLPVRATGEYSPVVPTTEAVSVKVVEGDPEARNPDYTVLKEWDVPLKTPYTEGSSRSFELIYEYDVDGILRVRATDLESGTVLLEDDVSYGVATDKRQLKAMSDRARSAVETGFINAEASVNLSDPEAAKLAEQAQVKVIPFLDADEAQPIRAAVEALQQADSSNLQQAKTSLKSLLAPYSFLF